MHSTMKSTRYMSRVKRVTVGNMALPSGKLILDRIMADPRHRGKGLFSTLHNVSIVITIIILYLPSTCNMGDQIAKGHAYKRPIHVSWRGIVSGVTVYSADLQRTSQIAASAADDWQWQLYDIYPGANNTFWTASAKAGLSAWVTDTTAWRHR
jgi:hypothetical protein